MRYEVLSLVDRFTVINTVEADALFMGAQYPAGNFREAPVAEPARQLTSIEFRARFTSEELSAIEWAAVDKSDESSEMRKGSALLRSFHRQLDDTGYVPMTGVEAYMAELVAKEAVTQLRSTEILQ